ncbi:unnamed protein product, partial [Symbiodinium microadriaticum]
MARVWSIFCEHWPRETFTVASDPCELKFPVDIDECFRRLKISKQKELLDVYCEELLSWTYLSTSCRQARELIRHRFDYIRSPRPFWQLCVFDWCFVCVTLIQDAKRNIAGRMWDNAATYLAANEVLSGLSHLPGFERAVATIARDIPLDTDTDSDADSGESSGSDVFPTPDYKSKQPNDPVGRHFQISTWVSTQKLRLISNAVRVNAQFFMVWRLRNQLEKDSLLEELTALLSKKRLEAMYEEAVREPYSFLYIYLLKPRDEMFHLRFDKRFQIGPGPAPLSNAAPHGSLPVNDNQQTLREQHPLPERVRPPWMQQPWAPQITADSTNSTSSQPGPPGRLFGRKKNSMTTIWVDSRKRVAGTDSDFEFDVGESVHLQGSAKLGVFKIRVADTFLSTDRGTYLYWRDTALGTLNWAQQGAYTGVRLATWVSSNFAAATYVESRNELEVAYDGNRLILNDQELRAQFPGSGSYPSGATPARPLSINHLLGPSFINEAGNQHVFTFVQMQPYSEIYLRRSSLANAAETVGPLGHDIIAKIVCRQGVGHIMEADNHENHMMNLRGPITLRYLRFKLTDYEGNVVNLRGTSLSFCVYLASVEMAPEPAPMPVARTDRFEENEQLMLRQFWKKYPTYNLNALMRKRYEELMDAKAFNEWLQNRQLKQQGEEYLDAMGRMAEAVNRRVSGSRTTPCRDKTRCLCDDACKQNMEEQRVFGFRKRPQFSEVLEYINEGEPLNFDLPRRNATIYKSSLFYLDDFPQSTEPLAENPRPHTQLGAAVEDDFESADDGYQGRPFPQMRRPNFLRPGPDTDTEDEAYRRHGFNPPRPPDPGHPSSSFSGRVGEAAAAGVTGIIAAGTNGVGQAAQNFGFTNIIGRPTDAQRVIEQAGQRAQEIQRAAAQDIEQFAAEQAAAETAEITPLLAETGAGAGEAAAGAAGAGALEVLGGAVGAALAPEVAIPAAIGLAAGAGGALAGGAGRSEAGTQTAPPSGSRMGALGRSVRSRRFSLPDGPQFWQSWRGCCGWAWGSNIIGLGLGAVGGAYEGARYMLGGNGGDAVAASESSGDQAPDIRTLNNMQQGAPQQQISLRAPRVQQPMVLHMDDAPMTQQQSQPRAQVNSRPPDRLISQDERQNARRVVTNAVNDELMQSLDYKMRTSNASYVISRKDVQYFPSSLSTITPTTSRVVRVPLTSGSDFIDPESIKVAFRFVNNDDTNDYHPIMGHPACLIKRIQLFANGQRTDDIDNYARTVHLYTLLKPREVLMAPTLVGLLGCGKMLPPQLNLVLEIEFADPADTVRGGQNSSVDFSIQNVRVLASQVTLDSALVESFNRVLLSGRSLVFSYPTVHTQVTSVPARSTKFNVTVARACSKLLGAFVTFRANAAQEGVTDLERPGNQADGTSFLQLQMQIESLQYSHYPAKDFAAPLSSNPGRHLRLHLPKHASDKNMYEGSSFIAAYPVERVPKMPLSGISTRAGDLARFTFKELQARVCQFSTSERGP